MNCITSNDIILREVYTSNSKKIGTDGMYVSIWDQEWMVKSKKNM